MNWKCIIIGALVFYVVVFILGIFVSGPLIHEGVLDPLYSDNESFWRPELNQDPPDMGPLMPLWIASGLIVSLIVAGLYCCFRAWLGGPEWRRGMVWCVCLGIFAGGMMLSWHGVFNLPAGLWLWWGIDMLVRYAIAGAVMGWAVGKWAPLPMLR